VIGSNGKLSGYRWGVERKQKLLEIESAQEHSTRAGSHAEKPQ
jgi:AraC family transcriptional regulator of adaptative response/methylated-DNA-[protein]-cysteine methyltransferase